MKFFGLIKDPKDVTTKEYVDNADTALDNKKINKEDVTEYTSEEVQDLWNQVFQSN